MWSKALIVCCLLAVSHALAGETSPADQKWLAAVEKMVAEGQATVSTPSETRVELLKDWSKKNGYSTNVAKADGGFRIELSKSASKTVAKK